MRVEWAAALEAREDVELRSQHHAHASKMPAPRDEMVVSLLRYFHSWFLPDLLAAAFPMDLVAVIMMIASGEKLEQDSKMLQVPNKAGAWVRA